MDFVEFFKSLADENRLRIIRLLQSGSFNVAEIHFIIGGKQSNVSHHLKILQNNNIVTNNKEGLQVYYRLNNFSNNTLFCLIDSIKENKDKIKYYQEDLTKIQIVLEDRKKTAQEYFNNIGDKIDVLQKELFENIYSIDEALDFLTSKYKNIVDIGCGTGKNMKLLSRYCDNIIGIDISQKMLQLSEHFCKENSLNYKLFFGDFLSLPIDDNIIDCVFINMVLHHISLPEIAIGEINRILNKKGKLLLIDLLSHNDNRMRDKHADLWLGFEEQYLLELLEEKGFRVSKKKIKSSPDSDKRVIIILAEKK